MDEFRMNFVILYYEVYNYRATLLIKIPVALGIIIGSIDRNKSLVKGEIQLCAVRTCCHFSYNVMGF